MSAREPYKDVREVRRQRQQIHEAGLRAGESVPNIIVVIFTLTFAYITPLYPYHNLIKWTLLYSHPKLNY